MGLKSQYQVGMKQREKRKKKRVKLAAKGQNASDYFYGKYYLKSGKE
ncbi:MAG: hypothetical protein NTW09_05515 [Candidatus Omnitrophica bacterium]|nr:hypothetical protein [Candidatus Omnitrophota bacterium]